MNKDQVLSDAITTREFFNALTKIALQQEGYSLVKDETRYIQAVDNETGKYLMILVTGRCLLKNESTPIRILGTSVKSLKRAADQISGTNAVNGEECIPCLGFGVAKNNSFDDFEITIVPVSVIENVKKEKGAVYVMSDLGYWYNYNAMTGTALPPDAILRYCWTRNEK